MQALDWIVMGLYVAGMLAVGWYSSHRTRTGEEYMLGSWLMTPWAVGLSLFGGRARGILWNRYKRSYHRIDSLLRRNLREKDFIFMDNACFICCWRVSQLGSKFPLAK